MGKLSRHGVVMMKELLNGGVWNKTSQLISDKYGKRIEFRFLTIPESDQSFYSKGDDLVIPLQSRKRYLGDVVIHRGAAMSIDEKMEVTDLIQFLIEPQAYNIHLKNVENNLQMPAKSDLNKITKTPVAEIKSYSAPAENVISIFGHPEIIGNQIDTEIQEDKKKTISNILHLKSKKALLRHKVALQIHEISGSSFFIRMQDISKSIHSVSDLADLSGSTIYIEDLLQLSSSELQIIADYAQDHQQIDLQFLIGSDLTDQEISSLPCHEQLKNDLLGFLFEIDKVPLHQQAHREVLELLFFTFSENIS